VNIGASAHPRWRPEKRRHFMTVKTQYGPLDVYRVPQMPPMYAAATQFDVATVATLGFVLDGLFSKIGGLIQAAENAGEVLLSSAGAQIATAIQYAKTAYLDVLDTTIDKLTNAQKSVIDDLTTEVGYVEHHVIEQLKQIVDRGSMVINALPLSNHFPQVGWYSPSYVAPSSTTVLVEFSGNFFDASRQGYAPTVSIGGHTFTPVSSTTLKLGFAVPVAVFNASANDLTFASLDLSVPYRKSEIGGIFHSREVAHFSAMLTILPAKAGTIVFDTDHLEMRRFTQPNRSGEFRQESTNDDIPDPIGSGRVSQSAATPGWLLNPADVHLIVNWAEGDWKDFGNRSNVTTAAWSIATVHHSFGTSGKVHFVLAWTEYQDRPVHVPAEQSADLAWGSSRTFTVPPGGTWTAKYTDFRGKTFDIGSAAFQNPFVKVTTSGNTVIIVTVP
jgi:hypothetical protein